MDTRRGGSSEYPQSIFSRNKRNSVYPCKPQFYYIKVGFKGVNIYRHVFVMFSRRDMWWKNGRFHGTCNLLKHMYMYFSNSNGKHFVIYQKNESSIPLSLRIRSSWHNPPRPPPPPPQKKKKKKKKKPYDFCCLCEKVCKTFTYVSEQGHRKMTVWIARKLAYLRC